MIATQQRRNANSKASVDGQKPREHSRGHRVSRLALPNTRSCRSKEKIRRKTGVFQLRSMATNAVTGERRTQGGGGRRGTASCYFFAWNDPLWQFLL